MTVARMAVCAAVLMVLSAPATQLARAAPALATNNVNLRQGPGTNFPVVSTIPAGSQVEISGCSGQWCAVVWQGQTGYSIATSFDQGGPNGAEGAP
ncbi:MAG TPA: SH3 domain-containing protein, partial [Xanthobacteraceae bacterium]|nr:SH3 domain-containing protein [Xanthobacteraceae bacterium]